MINRFIIMVIDGFGVGEAPDADKYGDIGSNTLVNIYNKVGLNIPNMKKMGLFNIDGINISDKADNTIGAYGKLTETADGKNSPVGHWEICGYAKHPAFTTYPNAFPKDLLDEFIRETGCGNVLCNEVGSGTEILKRFGEEHVKTGFPIIYTSADSVFQIEAHENIIPVPQLYKMCETARRILDNPKYNVGTVIARPFVGTNSENFQRTYNRRDFESNTFGRTMLDVVHESNKDMETIAIGKIEDLFSGRGITKSMHTNGNSDGIEKTIECIKQDSIGIIFTNLVDTDMLYGHRNNVEGYKGALEYFDSKLPEIMDNMKDDDVLIITSDHGNDPTTPSTNHSREYTPILVYGNQIKENINIGTRATFSDICATILDVFNMEQLNGTSFKSEIVK